jgi:hypothetical protein
VVYRNLSLDPVLSQLNTGQTAAPSFCKIHCSIVVLSMPSALLVTFSDLFFDFFFTVFGKAYQIKLRTYVVLR